MSPFLSLKNSLVRSFHYAVLGCGAEEGGIMQEGEEVMVAWSLKREITVTIPSVRAFYMDNIYSTGWKRSRGWSQEVEMF
jgi:hypothetical protein